MFAYDEQFTPVGKQTGICYQADFDMYRRKLLTMDSDLRDEIFEFYDNIVFLGVPTRKVMQTQLHNDDEQDGGLDDLDAELRRLDISNPSIENGI